jgi:hypothetical protein
LESTPSRGKNIIRCHFGAKNGSEKEGKCKIKRKRRKKKRNEK